MPQSRKMSLVEAVVQTAATFAVSVLVQYLKFPDYGLPRLPLADMVSLTLWFVGASIAVKYAVRRCFEGGVGKI